MSAASRTAPASTDFADAPRVSASDAKNSFGRILDRVAREGRVAITKHDEPCAMLISIDEYRSLVETGRRGVRRFPKSSMRSTNGCSSPVRPPRCKRPSP